MLPLGPQAASAGAGNPASTTGGRRRAQQAPAGAQGSHSHSAARSAHLLTVQRMGQPTCRHGEAGVRVSSLLQLALWDAHMRGLMNQASLQLASSLRAKQPAQAAQLPLPRQAGWQRQPACELTQTVSRLRSASSAGMPTCGGGKPGRRQGQWQLHLLCSVASRLGAHGVPAVTQQRHPTAAGVKLPGMQLVEQGCIAPAALTVSTTRPSASCSRNLRVPSAAATEWCSTDRPVRTPCVLNSTTKVSTRAQVQQAAGPALLAD